MSQETNDGTAYLLALKGSGNSHAPAGVAPAREIGTVPTAAPLKAVTEQSFSGVEKRRTPRFKCEGSAELRQEDSDVRTWATFKDISMHGCYVEMAGSYPVGTVVNVKLEANGFQVHAQGSVRVSYPGLGLGIAFQNMAEEERGRLKELVRTISRPVVVGGPGLASSLKSLAAMEALPGVSDTASALRALLQYFENRQAITRSEFVRVLHASQAPKSTR